MMNRIEKSYYVENIITEASSPGIRPGLERIKRLLSILGNPQDTFKTINVVGTNGKGSVTASLSSILTSSGYLTARYTSPHLETISERLTVNGAELPISSWIEGAQFIADLIESDPVLVSDRPSYFETFTALSFFLAMKNNVEVAVLEAGMGGRLDATNHGSNVILTVITNISEDHKEYLGETIEEIAGEKFTVISENGLALYVGQNYGLTKLFKSICTDRNAECHVFTEEARLKNVSLSIRGSSYDLEFHNYRLTGLMTPLVGTFQVSNNSLSVVAALLASQKLERISNNSITEGLKNTKWPGRMEIIGKEPLIILDGAHNPDGISSLLESIEALWPKGKRPSIAFVFATMKDKDYALSLKLLSTTKAGMYFTEVPENSRSEKAEILLSSSKEIMGNQAGSTFRDPLKAIEEASRKYDLVVVCGSLYLLGYVRPRLVNKEKGINNVP